MNDPHKIAAQALSLVDLTRLEDDDSDAVISALCQRAHTPFGPVAAVCIKPEFITAARTALASAPGRSPVRIATVVNFPDGSDDIERVERETRQAVAAGADEIDLVFPWRALLDGNETVGEQLVRACRKACPGKLLKVILESGELLEPTLIRAAGEQAIAGGADFLKTSTGKVALNATLSAASVMLELIREHGGTVGFKAAGGIRSTADAAAYLALAGQIMGPNWISPDHFRFGASGLLDDLLASLGSPPSGETRDTDY